MNVNSSKFDFVYRNYENFTVVYLKLNDCYILLENVYSDFFKYYFCNHFSAEKTTKVISEEYDAPTELIYKDLRDFINSFNSLISKNSTECNGTISNNFSNHIVYDRMAQKNIPFSATIEVVDTCNLHCVHCYRQEDKKTFWDRNSFRKVLFELRSLGTMHLTLTGGEPMCHPQFCDFLSIASELGFVISIQTNATLVDNFILKAVQSNHISDVSISLYSVTNSVHDSITGISGSCAKTKQAIETLCNAGVRVSINAPIFLPNKNSMPELKRFGDKMGLDVNFSLKIIPSQIPGKQTENLNVFDEDFLRLCINDPEIRLYHRELPSIRNTSPSMRYCQTGFRSVTFDSQGNMLICNAFRKKCGSLLDYSLKEL